MMYQVIGVPLGLVALDIGSDGNLLYFMYSYLKATNTTVLTNNSTENNFTMQHNNSLVETGNKQARALDGLFVLCFVLHPLLLADEPDPGKPRQDPDKKFAHLRPDGIKGDER